MPFTQIFDQVIFDSVLFDTRKNHTVQITERKTMYDDAIFDSALFDTTRGGEVVITDLLARTQGIQRQLSESSSLSDSITAGASKIRALADTISLTDSFTRVKAG